MASNSRHQKPTEIGVKVLTEKTRPGYRFVATLQNHQVECYASLDILDVKKTPSPSELIEILKEVGVHDTIDMERLALFCEESARGCNQSNVLLAAGTAPEPGIDGWFELAVRTSADEAEFLEDAHGNIDFRTQRTYTNVNAGDLIGTLHPPQKGTPGSSAHGLPVEALMGQHFNLKAGDGVKFNADDGTAMASKAGRVILDSKGLLTVSEQVVVSGDLNLEVGNIDFNGFVEIRGDVLDGFNIRAGKGIKVSGTIGACRIESDGSVEIGSAAGKGCAEIICKGDLKARYLNEVTVECMGHVFISHEIRNSIVKSAGQINAGRGTISGGETVALEGIEAAYLGSAAGLQTKFTSGVYFPEADRLSYLTYRVKSTTLQIKRIDDTLGPLSRKKDNRQALQEAIELRIEVLTNRKEKLVEEKNQVKTELQGFKVEEHPTANPKINATVRLREGAILTLGDQTEDIKIEHGPCSVIANSAGEGLRFLSMTPLKITAHELEDELLDKEAEAKALLDGNSDSLEKSA